MRVEEEDVGLEGDQWILARWLIRYEVQIIAVQQRNGKPCLRGGPGCDRYNWMWWRSYHAARKYQRAHSELEGYFVCNFSALERASRKADEIRDRTIVEEAMRRTREQERGGK